MNKELVLSKLGELGFELKEIEDYGYLFRYEDLSMLYIPDEDDDNFLRFALPNVFDVTDENRPFVLEVVNDTNMTIKYTKTCVYDDDVWAFYEYRTFNDDNLEDIIEHGLVLLQSTCYVFRSKVEGDDSYLKNIYDEMNNEEKEDTE